MNTLATTANPAEIARKAMRRLAALRAAPNPENFAREYRAAACDGAADTAPIVEPEQVLSHLVRGITARCADSHSAIRLQELVRERAWNSALRAVDETVNEALAEPMKEWPRMLQQLLAQLDISHANWTRARKLAAVRHALLAPSAGERTRETLQRLLDTWAAESQIHTCPATPIVHSPHPGDTGPARHHSPTGAEAAALAAKTDEAAAWRALALAAMDITQSGDRRRSTAAPESGADALVRRLEDCTGAPGEDWLAEVRLACNVTKAEAHRQNGLRERLVNLLRLVCQNLALFAEDGSWVNGQVTHVTQLLDAPLDERVLAEAEDRLRRAMERQAALKGDLNLAKAAVRGMLDSLIDRLSAAAASSGEFHRRIGDHATAIKSADDLPSLSRVVTELLGDTAELRDGMQKTHNELSAARENAQQYEERVHALEKELVDVSNLVRIDPLTEVLNRRGLEEAFAIEQARADRDGTALSVALLDIDNFKRLNDSFGHQTGDMALRHVSDMVRGALRPTDTVARYGGEEFVILLPATSAAEGINVMMRAQRQLTRAIFLHKDDKILITFSAGITDYRPGDSHDSVIGRADAAVYVAKAAGKNRVELG